MMSDAVKCSLAVSSPEAIFPGSGHCIDPAEGIVNCFLQRQGMMTAAGAEWQPVADLRHQIDEFQSDVDAVECGARWHHGHYDYHLSQERRRSEYVSSVGHFVDDENLFATMQFWQRGRGGLNYLHSSTGDSSRRSSVTGPVDMPALEELMELHQEEQHPSACNQHQVCHHH
jgi:hypothetical protein